MWLCFIIVVRILIHISLCILTISFYLSIMQTSRGLCYPQTHSLTNMCSETTKVSKKLKRMPEKNIPGGCFHFFESLPDDLVLSILSKLSSTATSSSDFISVLTTCKRLNILGLNSCVLSKASNKIFVKAKNWCDSAHQFLKRCIEAGNIEACYTLGMIRFYCLQNRGSGASLMAKAAMKSHAPSLYSLAVIQFNGSGGTKNDKDLRAGVALCARAAFLGHIDGLRELGHCLQDGYGVKQNFTEGRRFLVQANARELAAVMFNGKNKQPLLKWSVNPVANLPLQLPGIAESGCPLLSDFGCNVPLPEPHPANWFLTEWFAIRGGFPGQGMRLCTNSGCGRPETRKHEFRRCSVCGVVNYCSRACQALDWKFRHKAECTPAERWLDEEAEHVDGEVNGGVNVEEAVVLNR